MAILNDMSLTLIPTLRSHSGMSLIEVVLIIAFLAVLVLPMTILIQQGTQHSRGVNVQSTRSLFQASAVAEKDARRPDYTTLFNDTTFSTTLTDTGTTIPIMTQVDTTNSDTFQRTAYLYTYQNTSSAVSSPETTHRLFKTYTTYRLRLGTDQSFVDSAGRFWTGDGLAYNATNKQPGYVTGSEGTTGCGTLPTMSNTSTLDAELFRYCRVVAIGTPVEYRFDVPNGDYVVTMYFTEINASVDDTTQKRRINISIEGATKNSSPYSPWATTGGTFRAHALTYDVTVADGILNLLFSTDASTNLPGNLFAITVQKRMIAG